MLLLISSPDIASSIDQSAARKRHRTSTLSEPRWDSPPVNVGRDLASLALPRSDSIRCQPTDARWRGSCYSQCLLNLLGLLRSVLTFERHKGCGVGVLSHMHIIPRRLQAEGLGTESADCY